MAATTEETDAPPAADGPAVHGGGQGEAVTGRPAVGRPAVGRPFVGRRAEWAELQTALATVKGGLGQLVFVVGEPGIGKTRVLDEFAAHAAASGARVAWGRCWESGGAPAYFPIAQALRSLWRTLDDDERRALAGSATAPAAQLLPELATLFPPPAATARATTLPTTTAPAAVLGAPPGGEPNQARFELFEAVAQVLRQVSAAEPVVLALDDLHGADRASLAMLSYLTRELRSMAVLILGTFRDVEVRLSPEISAELGRIGREGILLHLPRLDRAESGELVQRLGAADDPRLAEALYQTTQGNPLFLAEMLRGSELGRGWAGRTMTAAFAPNPDALPHGVRELIRQRLAWLPEDARQVLETAAVLGHEFLPARIAEVLGTEVATVEAALARPREAGVVVERAERRLGFGHALFREVLYRDLSGSGRRTLHAAVLAATERRHQGDPRPPFAELAHHALEAGPEALEAAVGYAARAADAALEVAAYEDAVAVLERAHALAADQAQSPRPRAEALLALGLGRIRAGDGAAGREACRQTADLARALGDGALFARAALAFGTEIFIGVIDPTLVGLLEESLQRLGPEENGLRARVLARLAGALQPALDPQRPIALAREAMATARRAGDDVTLLATLHAGMAAMMDYVEPAERAPLNREIVALATRLGDGQKMLRAHARLVFDLVELPDLVAAAAHQAEYSRLADESRLDHHRWRASLMAAMLAVIEGRFAEADGHLAEAGTRATACRSLEATRIIHAFRGFQPFIRTDYAQGRVAAAEFGRLWHNLPGGRDIHRLNLACLAAHAENAEETSTHLDAIPADSLLYCGDPSLSCWCAEPVALVRDQALARRLLSLLPDTPGRCISTGMSAHSWLGPVARFRGLLLGTLEEGDQADAAFAVAREQLQRLGARPYLARVEYEWARELLHRGRPADRPRARALLEAALATARTLEMTGLIRLAERRLATDEGAGGEVLTGASSEPRTTTVGPVPAASPPILSLVREGEYWTLTWLGAGAAAGSGSVAVASGSDGQRTVRLKDSRGLRILSQLLDAPGQDFPALALAAQTAADGQAPDGGDAGEWLDETARRAYRDRMADLRATLAEAEERADQGRIAVARAELDALSTELSRAVGLGGRGRRAGSAAERARVAVQRRIKDALGRIEEAAPEAGRHLARTIYTGLSCCYRPSEPRRVR